MVLINTIIIIILGIAMGFIMSFPISKILIKRHKRKIAKNSAKKILKQDHAYFKTLQGKPVNLKFINDGEEVDLKKQIKKELIETKKKEIIEHKEKIKEIKGPAKKTKKQVKKSTKRRKK